MHSVLLCKPLTFSGRNFASPAFPEILLLKTRSDESGRRLPSKTVSVSVSLCVCVLHHSLVVLALQDQSLRVAKQQTLFSRAVANENRRLHPAFLAQAEAFVLLTDTNARAAVGPGVFRSVISESAPPQNICSKCGHPKSCCSSACRDILLQQCMHELMRRAVLQKLEE